MTVIAERELRFTQPGKRGARKVLVRIHAPAPEENGNWSVCFEIHGPGEHKTSRSVWGADSVQALVLALANIPLDLSLVAHEMGGTIKFLGRKDLGFTVSPPQ
ncbi:hypothetical protein KEG38_39390 [Polyangium jinanense]|uniref:DUF6968 family protein n=1 Tax=Polyangium jinanense TaxID=2829994 RepID=UPI0023416EA7|nr:hypothetical protein [Polyangium jinanense]MDC3959985.1 hypothetical protein [Polyangium jinanense]